MKFEITGKSIWNDTRNYIALGFEILAWLLSLPSVLCRSIAKKVKV